MSAKGLLYLSSKEHGWSSKWNSGKDIGFLQLMKYSCKSFYYTERQRFKGCQTDIRCCRWSLISVSGPPWLPPSSAWGSRMPVCPRESSERSCPWREPGHDNETFCQYQFLWYFSQLNLIGTKIPLPQLYISLIYYCFSIDVKWIVMSRLVYDTIINLQLWIFSSHYSYLQFHINI